jgi:cell division protein FtsI (penicillin-binding protein 3)
MKTAPARKLGPDWQYRWRSLAILALLMCGAVALVARAVELQLVDRDFLRGQGDARFSRVARISAHRGTITDRFGEPLAVSTPVDAVWVNPPELSEASDQIARLARTLGKDKQSLARRVSSSLDRDYLVVARPVHPDLGTRIKNLEIPGVYLEREYRRYYPAGEVAGHVLGFTSLDELGQEGLELAYDHWLGGEDGAKRVIQDSLGHVVEDVESIRPARPGQDLVTSLDLRIQYLAYRELKAAIIDNRARAGSVVVLDVATGEVLAMVNQPAYNPNDREQIEGGRFRNRAATDIFEPGSSIKPFIVAAALASGKYDEQSHVDTSPGFFRVGIKIIEDKHNLGAIGLSEILEKSSNVGIAKIALTLPPERIWHTLTDLGFGQVTSSDFPGESAGLLSNYSHWRPIGIATMAYGYGLSVTPLQLAHAYATLGAGGVARPVSFVRVDGPVAGQRVLDERLTRTLIHMMETVVTAEGTGLQAAIRWYRVAGKTGTAWKSNAGGYSTDKYMAVFAGLVPASRPRLACVVVIDEPGAGKYYGGDVAAPVFSSVMAGALRLMAIPPDARLPVEAPTMAQAEVTP